MRYRKRMNKRRSRRNFRRGFKIRRKNRVHVRRGGYRA